MARITKKSSVKIRFIINKVYQNQEACSTDMKLCCKKCLECNFSTTWIDEKDCLLLKPTKQEIFVCEKFEGNTFEYLSTFKCVVMSPRVLSEFLKDGVPLPHGGTQLFNVAMKDCIVTIGNFPAQQKKRLKKLVTYMNGYFSGRAINSVTHLVVPSIGRVRHQKALADGVCVMTEHWIEQVWVASQRSNVWATERRFSQYALPVDSARPVAADPPDHVDGDADSDMAEASVLEPSCEEASEEAAEEVEIRYECDICKKQFVSKQYLKIHVVEAHTTLASHPCGLCGKVLATAARLQYHLQAHNKTHRCNVCGKTFAYSNLLREHLIVHSGAQRHACPTCDRTYVNLGDLRQHQKTHTISYSCDVCGQKFVYKNSLKKHLELHTGKLNHVCDLCSKSYTCASGLKKHKQERHGSSTTHSCYVCKQQFKFYDALKEHLKTHRKREHNCDVCTKSYMSANTLRKHKLAHSNPHRCEFCGKQFAFKDSLVTHLKVHANGKTFKCKFCDKSYGAETYLRQHMRTHTNSFECHECHKVFGIKNSLIEHVKAHLGVRKHKCSVCGKNYVNGRKLRQHEKTHTESFKCFFCDKTCSRFPTLKVHFQTHSGLKNFKCTLCKDRAYTTARGLKLHTESIHGDVKAVAAN